MKLSHCSCVAFCIGAVAASTAMAIDPIHWITDARNCSASFSGNGSGSSWNDPSVAFDAFQGAADIQATNGIETWTSQCTQFSEMDGDSARFDAWATGTVMALMGNNPLAATATAKFDVWFSIDAPMEYHLSGLISESDYAGSASLVRLTTLDGTVVTSISSVTDSARGFRRSGIIQPGTYRIYAEATSRCRTFSPLMFAHGESTCNMRFAVNPAPVDPPPPDRPTITSSSHAPRRP